eukprot:scpid2859/ scgid34913/ 
MSKVTVETPGRWLMPKPFVGFSAEDLQAFMNDFRLCLQANNYVPVAQPNDTFDAASRERLELMVRVVSCKSLTGSAALMLQSLSDTQREDRAEIETALHARFGDTGKELLRQTELQARKRRAGETLTELGDAIQVLVAKAYPGAPGSILNTVAIRAFLDALSPDMRRRVGDHEPQTLMNAVQKAVVPETQDQLHPAAEPVFVASATPEITARLDSLEKLCATQTRLLETLCTQSESPAPDRWSRGPRCFGCGQQGHLRRDCRSNPRDRGRDPRAHQGNPRSLN